MPKILVAEDEPSIRTLIEVNLAMEGYDVVTAQDGQEAIDMARDQHPDVILLDVMMPRLDGWTVKKMLEDDPDLSAVPVVFLSARAQESDLKKGLDAGAADYVVKPFEPAHLIAVVAKVLEGGGRREEPQ